MSDDELIHRLIVAATPELLPEWVEAGAAAWRDRPDRWLMVSRLDDEVRVILAGALPRIVEHIAKAVEAGCPFSEDEGHGCDYPIAAQIVRDAFKPEARNAV